MFQNTDRDTCAEVGAKSIVSLWIPLWYGDELGHRVIGDPEDVCVMK